MELLFILNFIEKYNPYVGIVLSCSLVDNMLIRQFAGIVT